MTRLELSDDEKLAAPSFETMDAGLIFGDEAVSFFDLFANLPPADDTALAVIQGGLDRGVASALIERAARLLQGYELMYWDTMAEAAL